jgi:hypothetical protein
MNKLSIKKVFVLSSVLACSTGLASASLANETNPASTDETASVASLTGETDSTSPYSTFQVVQTEEESAQGQVTSVSQLSDVQPTDWAYQALQSLVERYGCIAGYPNGTFRGNRAATRYELAAALNACLDQISDRFATKEDLEAVKALQEEFKAELATLKGRVDSLEARAAVLEAQQFSTTTKLVGEVIFQGVQGTNARPIPAGWEAVDQAFGQAGIPLFAPATGDNFTFLSRATLNFLTSFTGKDLLVTSLQAGSYDIPGIGSTPLFGGIFQSTAASLAPSFNQATSAPNSFGLYYLGYRFPILNDKGTVYTTLVGGELSDFTDTLNPNFDSDGQGALSGFGIRNPLYRQISGRYGGNSSGTGLGVNYNFSDKLSLSVGYLAPSGDAADSVLNSSSDSAGLFGGSYAAMAQLTFKPTKSLGLGLTYVRSYADNAFDLNLGGGSGSFRANNPFLSVPTSANSAGFQFSWNATPRFALSGWAGATFANAETSGTVISNLAPTPANPLGQSVNFQAGSDATIVNFALAASFPDLFGKGNMGGLIFGMEPQVISSSVANNTDPDMNFHIEALYRFRVNDNISITPGIIAVINPEGNSNNDPVIIGTVRTTFSF